MVTQNDFFFTIATGRMGFSSPFELVNLRIYCPPWSPYSLCKTGSFKILLLWRSDNCSGSWIYFEIATDSV